MRNTYWRLRVTRRNYLDHALACWDDADVSYIISDHLILTGKLSRTDGTEMRRLAVMAAWLGNASSSAILTVELRSGVTGFATIYATGSHRFMLQVRNDERDEFNLRQKKGGELDLSLAHACYHFSLKYHRALSDFQAGCSPHETTNCDIGS